MDIESLTDDDLEVEAVDGFTWREVLAMFFDSVVPAVCGKCDEQLDIEPDADREPCPHCGCCAVTSPLVKLGLV